MRILYSIKLARKNLGQYKSKVSLVLIGIIISMSLLTSVNIWNDTSEKIMLSNFSDQTDYLVSSTGFLNGETFNITQYAANEDLFDRYDISVRSQVIFNSFTKNDSYRFYPFDQQQNLSDPVYVSNILLTNITGFERLNRIFKIEGRMPLDPSEIALSPGLINKYREIYNETIGLNSEIDISVARRIPFIDNGEKTLISFQKIDFPKMKIVGIIEYNNLDSLTRRVYDLQFFDEILYMPIENTSQTDLDLIDKNGLRPNYMFSIKKQALIDNGVDGLIQMIRTILERIRSRIWFATPSALSGPIIDFVTEFNFSFNSTYYYYPLIALSLLLSTYTAYSLLQNREKQIRLLKERGATYSDIVQIYSLEFFIIALMGLVIGVPLSIFLSTIIPTIKPNGSIDLNLAEKYARNIEINYAKFFNSLLTVFGLYLISAIYWILRTVYTSQIEKQYGKFRNYTRYLQLVVVLIIAIEYYLLLDELPDKATIIQEFTLTGELELKIINIILLQSILWIFVSYYLAQLLMKGLRSLNWLIYRLFPKLSLVVNNNLRRRTNNLALLSFFIIYLVSLLTFSITLGATYDLNDQQTQEFLNGADLRIYTDKTYANFTEELKKIEGIDVVTPIYYNIAHIVSTVTTVYAVDPETFTQVGNWDYAKGQGDPRSMVSELLGNKSNVIISESNARRLNVGVKDSIVISGFENVYASQFNISGVIKSAPGLGLAGSSNPELGQTTRGWVMVSYEYVELNFEIGYTPLFLADVKEGYNRQQVIDELLTLIEVDRVNPFPIIENNTKELMQPYIPQPKIILSLIQYLTLILSLFFISLLTETILQQRKKEHAILIAVGIPRKHVGYMIYLEFFIVGLVSILAGLIFGVFLSNSAMNVFLPFTIKRLFVDIVYTIPWIKLLSSFLAIFLMTFFVLARQIRKIKTLAPMEEISSSGE